VEVLTFCLDAQAMAVNDISGHLKISLAQMSDAQYPNSALTLNLPVQFRDASDCESGRPILLCIQLTSHSQFAANTVLMAVVHQKRFIICHTTLFVKQLLAKFINAVHDCAMIFSHKMSYFQVTECKLYPQTVKHLKAGINNSAAA
jgi:hypothetical protein